MPIPISIADDARPRLAHGVRLQIDTKTGKAVLLYPEGIVELNDTAQEILTHCDGRTFREIVNALAEDYDVDLGTIQAHLRQTISDLQRRHLIELA